MTAPASLWTHPLRRTASLWWRGRPLRRTAAQAQWRQTACTRAPRNCDTRASRRPVGRLSSARRERLTRWWRPSRLRRPAPGWTGSWSTRRTPALHTRAGRRTARRCRATRTRTSATRRTPSWWCTTASSRTTRCCARCCSATALCLSRTPTLRRVQRRSLVRACAAAHAPARISCGRVPSSRGVAHDAQAPRQELA